MAGSIECIVGPMWAGKTEFLIRELQRVKIAKRAVRAFKHVSDVRYDDIELHSHGGVRLRASPVHGIAELDIAVRGLEVVGIDEVQFFDTDIVSFCEGLANIGIRVIVAGLDLDSAGRSFPITLGLMALAERVTKLAAVCVTCGADAFRSQRLVSVSGQVLVGGEGVYEARCRAHWTPNG